MSNTRKVAAYLLYAIAFVISLIVGGVRFANPALTETQLFLQTWPLILLAAVLFLAGYALRSK